MEPFIKKNTQVIGDLIIFGRQVGRDKQLDLLAVNNDGEVYVIELKKDPVGTGILDQVLGYRTDLVKSPEAVKNLWNQYKNKPEDVTPDWDNFNPKILIVAPKFDRRLLEIVDAHGLPIEFVEIDRYLHGESAFIVIDEIEPSETRVRPVKAREEYDWNWYLEHRIVRTQSQLEIAKSIHDQILTLSGKNNWNISPKFNKKYVAFKYGRRSPFWLGFRHVDKALIGVNLRDQNNDPSTRSSVKWNWDKNWNYWYAEIDDPKFDIGQIENILVDAYNNTVE